MLLRPSRLDGMLCAPPSKSLMLRAAICAALAKGESRLTPIARSDDMLRMLAALRALGLCEYAVSGDTAIIRGRGIPEARENATAKIDCGASASVLRFLLPVALLARARAVFIGDESLAKRPTAPMRAWCQARGIAYREFTDRGLRIEIEGALAPGRYELPGDVSSQFATGLMLALPQLSGSSEIALRPPVESKPYLDLTRATLADFGVSVDLSARIAGCQRCAPRDYRIEGDYSQAAAFLCAGALGGDVSIAGLKPDSAQGDRAILDVLRAMGAAVEWRNGAVCARAGKLRGIAVDVADCPDIAPLIALICALAEGESRVENAGRLRLKECDRLGATRDLIAALGGEIEIVGDTLRIRGVSKLVGGRSLDCQNDHRMAMLLAVASTRCEKPVEIRGAQCVAKSYPNFWDDFHSLGGDFGESLHQFI